ncbi:hypothetical protein D3C87_1890190 [compost metagenome]
MIALTDSCTVAMEELSNLPASSASVPACPASPRTSVAMTPKDCPAAPAEDASIAALIARILVWKAISLMLSMIFSASAAVTSMR